MHTQKLKEVLESKKIYSLSITGNSFKFFYSENDSIIDLTPVLSKLFAIESKIKNDMTLEQFESLLSLAKSKSKILIKGYGYNKTQHALDKALHLLSLIQGNGYLKNFEAKYDYLRF